MCIEGSITLMTPISTIWMSLHVLFQLLFTRYYLASSARAKLELVNSENVRLEVTLLVKPRLAVRTLVKFLFRIGGGTEDLCFGSCGGGDCVV